MNNTTLVVLGPPSNTYPCFREEVMALVSEMSNDSVDDMVVEDNEDDDGMSDAASEHSEHDTDSHISESD
ncbi:hypothetical protein FQR65_LT19458 [Abscondita terminalis]|nr:hypothetical protein FQR65_LT19458 [Abscondita terminalis]